MRHVIVSGIEMNFQKYQFSDKNFQENIYLHIYTKIALYFPFIVVVRAILIGGAILIISVSNFRNRRD